MTGGWQTLLLLVAIASMLAVESEACWRRWKQQQGAAPRQRGASPSTPTAKEVPAEFELFAQPERWRTVSEGFFDRHGRVTLAEGTLRLAAGSPGTGVRFSGLMPREDYELSLEARRVVGNDFFCGLTFPIGAEHATLILGGWGGGSTGISNVNDIHADENETNGYLDIEEGRWYAVRLRVTRERIGVWIDGEQTIDLPREGNRFSLWWEQEPLRPLGLATWNTTGEFRRCALRKIDH